MNEAQGTGIRRIILCQIRNSIGASGYYSILIFFLNIFSKLNASKIWLDYMHESGHYLRRSLAIQR